MSDELTPRNELREELYRLAHGSLFGDLTAAETQNLERLVVENPEARRWYYKCICDVYNLRKCSERNLTDAAARSSTRELSVESATSADDADFSALCEQLATEKRSLASRSVRRSPMRGLLHRMLHIGGETPVATALMWLVMAILLSGTVLTAIFIGMMVFGPKRPDGQPNLARSGEQEAGRKNAAQVPSAVANTTPVARLIRMVDCHWEGGRVAPALGDEFAAGRKLVLKSGLAEIIFQGGARTLLQGPATLEIRSRLGVYLQQGKFTVAVENPLAKGFEVRAPGMKYTDLGTEFGVFVATNGEQEVNVFRGRVQAEVVRDEGEGARRKEADTSSSASAPSPPVVLSANQAIHVAAPNAANAEDRQVRQVAPDDKQFIRAMPAPKDLPLYGTGEGLNRGAIDSHWEITNISTDKDFKSQPAVVADPLPIYLRGQRDKAQWISKSQALQLMPDACRCTYRTRIDLTGFDSSTAHIEGRLAADDYVAEILLNGKTVPLPAGTRGPFLYAKWLAFKIDGGFVAGENTLEIVIENSSNAQKGYVNTMALCVECKGTALPILTSKTDK
jgi:hypothetical protein